MGGNDDTLLGLRAAVAFSPSKGVGALADMGGNAAVLPIDLISVVPSTSSSSSFFLGASSDSIFLSISVFNAANGFDEAKLNGLAPLFPDPSPALDDVPEKLPKLKPSDDVCPFLPLSVAEAKFTPAKGFVGFDFWLSSLLLSSLLSFVALEVTLEGRTAFKVTGLVVIPLLSEADSGLVIV